MLEKPSDDPEAKLNHAEDQAARLRDVLLVLRMALGFETGSLEPDQRSAIEAVIEHAHDLARQHLETIGLVTLAVSRAKS